MPSLDERREVAARMREEANSAFPTADYYTLIKILGINPEIEPYFDGYYMYEDRLKSDIWCKLADLIEPEERTCEITRPNCSDFRWRCGICGEQFSTCDKPNFCPSCGARVEEGK